MTVSPVVALQSFLARVADALDSDAIPWLNLIQVLLAVVLAFELTISLRQLRTYSEPAAPATLQPHVSQETYEKSRDYGRDKLRFSIFSLVYQWILSASLIHVCAYARIWAAAGLVMHRMGYSVDSEVGMHAVKREPSLHILTCPCLP